MISQGSLSTKNTIKKEKLEEIIENATIISLQRDYFVEIVFTLVHFYWLNLIYAKNVLTHLVQLKYQ